MISRMTASLAALAIVVTLSLGVGEYPVSDITDFRLLITTSLVVIVPVLFLSVSVHYVEYK